MPRRPDMPPLTREALADDPVEQFAEWYERAQAEAPLADAICLATATPGGIPDARMVLLKGFDREGFRVHTNYESSKGRQLESNPRAAMVAYWRELDRQVRARGVMERLDAAESDAYFASRPRDRQVGAWASPQSRPLRDRAELDELVREVEARFGEREIPRPEGWGGFILRPDEIEFWQGQVGRLHDRFLYTREGEGWRIERLAP
jgi:pyridoxamine 5'-phosphate oxidase